MWCRWEQRAVSRNNPAVPRLSPSSLPDKLRLFVLDETSRGPLAGILLQLRLRLEGEDDEVVLGSLASDHVGYASFLLPSKKARAALNGSIDRLWLRLAGLAGRELDVDLLPHISDSLVTPYAVPLLIDGSVLSRAAKAAFPSIQAADVEDWKVSPASFSMVHAPIIGEDGCETLLPSTVTEELYQFHQLVRVPGRTSRRLPHVDDAGRELEDPEHPPLEVRHGRLNRYEMSFTPLGHALGRVLYSLTLAPCESVNLAVIDWSRDERSERTEETRLTDELLHDQRRDRAIEEAVEASLHEWQSGESFMGGTAGTGGYGGGGYGQMWGVTGSHSLGYSTASAEGRREVEADSVQQLVDRVRQASSLARNLRSTVVVQASQRERERFETRTVTNHNHGHALSVLYYEVVRHYCVQAKWTASQDVIFVRYDTLTFDARTAVEHAPMLRRALVDPRVEGGFDLLGRTFESELEELQVLQRGTIRRLIVRVEMGTEERSDSRGDALERDAIARLRLLIMKRDGTIAYQGFDASDAGHFTGDDPFSRSDPASPTINTRVFDLSRGTGTAGLTLDDVRELGLTFDVQGSPGFEARFRFTDMEVKAVVAFTDGDGTSRTQLVDMMSASEMPYFMNDTEWWSSPNQKPDTEALHAAIISDKEQVDALLEHLNSEAHNLHYNILLWTRENPNNRARRFENYLFTHDVDDDGRPETGRLIDFIDNTPIGVFGDSVAFAVAGSRTIEDSDARGYERIVSMPTRGAFAEAKLGHCNANEVIDETRFWDWQQSPCPNEAPAIAGIAPQPRTRATGLSPTTLPEPGVGVETPEAAPAPVGLAQVLDLLKTPDIFRDLTGLEELGSLLEKLVEVAGEVETARIAKLDAGEPMGSSASTSGGGQGSGTTGSSSGGLGRALSAPSQRTSAQELLGRAQAVTRAVRSAVDGGSLTPAAGDSIIRQALEGLAGPSAAEPVTSLPGVQSLIDQAGGQPGSSVRIQQGSDAFEYSGGDGLGAAEDLIQPVGWWDSLTPTSVEAFTVCVELTEQYADFRRAVVQASAEIRHGMISRSNPTYPEEVIDRRPDLRDIHRGFIEAEGYNVGDEVCIVGHIVRDERNYVLLIRFATRDVHIYDDDVIDATPDVPSLFDSAIAHTRRVANTMAVGEPRRRIHCLLDLATRLGPERALDLHTLDPLAVALFIDMSEAGRINELRLGTPPERYKHYVIRVIMYSLYWTESTRSNDARYREALEALDASIRSSIHRFERAVSGGTALFPRAGAFFQLRNWMIRQQADPDAAYHCYGGRVI